jgi:hypothetical protein
MVLVDLPLAVAVMAQTPMQERVQMEPTGFPIREAVAAGVRAHQLLVQPLAVLAALAL